MPPKPTPTAVLSNRGSWRADTRRNEPQPPSVPDLAPPVSLSPDARSVWDAIAPRLFSCGLLTIADVPTFSRYCRVYAAWESVMREVEEDGGRSAVLTLAKLDDMLRRLEANFGLSPADRTAINVPTPPAGKDRFFS